ncbi:MAG: hypothetical protein V4721_12450 [Bacteroidota bacterium]
MNRTELLRRLPVFKGNYELIKKSQSVPDIMREIETAHKLFSRDYDLIAFEFYYSDHLKILKALWSFCKANIEYRQETEKRQTSMNPAGILALARGDCKHYALFIGGVLCALNRAGIKIDWWYRFAGYKNATIPGHVFVVAKVYDREYWIDPVLSGFDQREQPELFTDTRILNFPAMPLYRVSGIEDTNSIGIASLTVAPFTGDNLNFDGSGKWAGVFVPYLGLSNYRDFGGDRDINEVAVAAAINTKIANGPNPGHTVSPDFVKWIYNTSTRSWNFYYPGGVKPGFTAANILPAGYPRLIITQDGRLTFDTDIKIDDYRNAEIHLLNAWAQALINQYDPTPYPIKPLHLKEFSQLLYGSVDTRNLFTERRGTSVFTDIGKALEDTVNFVKDKVMTVVGFIPRNSFLALIGLNGFNFAGNLWDEIQLGRWDAIARIWRLLGGIPNKLYNTVEDGKSKKAILGAVIGADPATDIAALLAAAAPVIAALLAFLDKDGKAKEILSATKTFLQTKYPKVDWSGFDFLDEPGGTPILWEGDPRYDENNPGVYNPGKLESGDPLTYLKNHPLLAAGIGAGVTYMLTRNKAGNTKIVMPLVIGGGIYLLLSKGTAITRTQKMSAIMQWINSGGDSAESKAAFQQMLMAMTESEINTIYTVITQYIARNVPVPQGSQLYIDFTALSNKYNVFS